MDLWKVVAFVMWSVFCLAVGVGTTLGTYQKGYTDGYNQASEECVEALEDLTDEMLDMGIACIDSQIKLINKAKESCIGVFGIDVEEYEKEREEAKDNFKNSLKDAG